VNLTLDSDWQHAKSIMQDIVNRHDLDESENAKAKVQEAARKYMIHYNKLTPIVYTNVAEGKIILTLRYLCEPRQQRTMQHLIWEEILIALSNEDQIYLL